ncbi:alpha/beta hydrolase [Rhizobiaceae bacterium BDR2-2]|uniref:Alpha/beta hydrolase n=1 Tax=Ectorhizobium quercum TaxID=2965071 RepID=A0AAE3MV80_9HYPH|nr:alpha/beta hydrolase [Ectorhizobium quercum]MCX8995494.1 alpha/beta hydrolase [Ectorhizobium quercum]
MLHLIRSVLVFLSFPLGLNDALSADPRLGPFEKPRPKQLAVPLGEETFGKYEALNGAIGSPDRCGEIPDALWVGADGEGECIRYYPQGLQASNSLVLVYFGGDVILRTRKAVRFVSDLYAAQSPHSIGADMAAWGEEAGTPAVFLARPGTYGSSGDHNMRRMPREIALMDGALDRLKARFNVGAFVLVGQSGGGHVAASLVNRRDDIAAVFISSGLLSVKRAMRAWEHRRSIPGRLLYDAAAFYDPIEDIEKIGREPAPAIWVISDPDDRVVPFSTQLHYVRRLRAAGFAPHHVYAHAGDARRHVLAPHAKRAAALFARGGSERDIRAALHALDIDNLERD